MRPTCNRRRSRRAAIGSMIFAALALALTIVPAAQGQEFTTEFNRDHCTFTTTGSNPHFPLWPGYVLEFEGEEEDGGEIIELYLRFSVLGDTETVDGVVTRVIEEYEEEDGEVIEISRNFYALCRETGDVWYFGEDVDIYEDGEIISHGGAWRSGADGAEAGVFMPGTPMLGARHFQEIAPDVALDRAEVVSDDVTLNLPAGTFNDVVKVDETSPLEPGHISEKWYAPGVGLIKDNEAELVEITPPLCQPDDTTLCLNDGRFKVQADWETRAGTEGFGHAILPSADAGEFWFFRPDNTELLVKVLDACDTEFNSFWVFAAGLTNVAVTIEVTDTQTGVMREYDNELGHPFETILATSAFETCP
jgi:hypothetical protein